MKPLFTGFRRRGSAIGRDHAVPAAGVRVLRHVGLIVRRHIKHPVMIDQAEANAVHPAESPEQILIDPFVGEKIHYRFEIQTERLDGDQMTKSLDTPGGSPECHWIARRHVEVGSSPCLRSNRQWDAPVSTWASNLTLSEPLFRNTGNEIPSPAGIYE